MTSLPNVTINMAMTLDGKVCRPDGKWYGLSSRNDKKKMDEIRSKADVLILGKNSIINDDPVIHLRYVENEKDPRPVILLRSGTLPEDKKVFRFSKQPPLIFCLNENYSSVRDNLCSVAEIVLIPGEDLSPLEVLKILFEMGYKEVLLEGGPSLNDSFFRMDLISRIHLTIVPFLIGQKDLPSITGGRKEYPNFDQSRWNLVSSEILENEVFLMYEKKEEV
ncbi:RibD family protein [Leptospira kmetyi]|uniref:Pyrimidine reductase n=1 Tax=Leptospira kmetyi TaxID=408139 RepID=A0A2M9XS56_9LEPT|nr:RibD family protein [Leptospira kmetyi]AYV56227.1 RibD family protein [Leptospira kmetyi]EQA53779.1 riboflavin biosynthesis protein RibD C-terminal domain protein [Leptospira kmetyi serovar Malaysia str. Bejo-Iso9]PJZ29885.1 pyrimidine reductase [Leptospira kmetyi]PJZ41983.1 pyrimidine reductase [Leptospira kmetyi]TGK15949.1 RibD family protein [Leptospira kmetyi]